MKEQFQMEQLSEIEQMENSVIIEKQSAHIKALEQQLEQLSQDQSEDKNAASILRHMIDKGDAR
jgi:hypothetical protein